MASVFKREGAGIANRWYAQIKIGHKWKVIRLPASYSGDNAIKKDKALHLAFEAGHLANKALLYARPSVARWRPKSKNPCPAPGASR